MTSDSGKKLDTPPYGIPLHEIRARITPVEIPAAHPHRTKLNRGLVEDIYVLGKWFARPRAWPSRVATYYFRPNSQNYVKVDGGIHLNMRFVEPLRELAYEGAYLHDFHSIVGYLGTSFYFANTVRTLSTDYDAWHDLILKAFFIDMLRTGYPIAGEILARFWARDLDRFTKTFNQLCDISTNDQADDFSRAAALRVFDYTASFFTRCHKTQRHDTYRLAALEHLDRFRTHANPLIANAATLSFRTLFGIAR